MLWGAADTTVHEGLQQVMPTLLPQRPKVAPLLAALKGAGGGRGGAIKLLSSGKRNAGVQETAWLPASLQIKAQL